MQGGNGTDAVPATYGTDQGYSEDYGAPSMKPAGGGTLSNDNYGAGKDDQREKKSKYERKIRKNNQLELKFWKSKNQNFFAMQVDPNSKGRTSTKGRN